MLLSVLVFINCIPGCTRFPAHYFRSRPLKYSRPHHLELNSGLAGLRTTRDQRGPSSTCHFTNDYISINLWRHDPLQNPRRPTRSSSALRTRRGRWYSSPLWILVYREGMYNTPSFTLARVIGGIASWWWLRRCDRRGEDEKKILIVIIASGFVLGEGVCSIINLGLAAAGL